MRQTIGANTRIDSGDKIKRALSCIVIGAAGDAPFGREADCVDLKQVEYILQIAKSNNITHAAKKLYITQSALNQQLLKLEKNLGTSLFHRSRGGWYPTQSGEAYIKGAEELLRIKKETYDTIQSITKTKKDTLSIALMPYRGISMLKSIYPIFQKKFPDIILRPVELNYKDQYDALTNGDMDIGFQTVPESAKPDLECIKLCSEDVLLTIPSGHSLAKHATVPFSEMDISMLRSEPFVLMYKKSTLRPLIDSIFSEAGFQPNILFETSSNNVIVTSVKSSTACGILPYYYVKDQLDHVACFYLPSYPAWDFIACYPKDTELSQAARHFIELAAEYWKSEISQEKGVS